MSSSPSSATRSSADGSDRPTVPKRSSSTVLIAPAAAVSVMPQPSRTSTPQASKNSSTSLAMGAAPRAGQLDAAAEQVADLRRARGGRRAGAARRGRGARACPARWRRRTRRPVAMAHSKTSRLARDCSATPLCAAV